MSKTKTLLEDMHSMDFYSVYADSEYWYNEWEKVNRDRVNNSNKIVLKKKDEEKKI